MAKAMELARRLANGPVRAIRWTKMACNKCLGDEINLVLDASLGAEIISMYTENHKETARAFVEKRAPVFKGNINESRRVYGIQKLDL